MGILKSQFMAEQERGWANIDDKNVCADCVGDDFLKQTIIDSVCGNLCDYCHTQSELKIATPAIILQKAIYAAVHSYFHEPANAGVPYDGGYVIEPDDISEVFCHLGLDCHPDLFDDLVDADTGNGYVQANHGHWATSSESESLCAAWSFFEETIKHRTRFNFSKSNRDNSLWGDIPTPELMLDILGEHLQQNVSVVPEETLIYRVRSRPFDKNWRPNAKELGAPPPELATSGRMNPPGIPYLYTSLEFITAVHEARANELINSTAFVGEFILTEDLTVIDLTKKLEQPSIFDVERRPDRESIIFIDEFIRKISQPITPDDKIHLSYIPTQVVSEYISQIFETPNGQSANGIIFPSSIHPDGKNLIIFPTSTPMNHKFSGVLFKEAFVYQPPSGTLVPLGPEHSYNDIDQ